MNTVKNGYLFKLFLLVLLLFAVGFSGCTHTHGKKQATAKAKEISEKKTASKLKLKNGEQEADSLPFPDEKPIVKIIRGKKVSDSEAAKNAVAMNEDFISGIHTTIKSIYFKDISVRCLAEVFSEISGYNVVTTNDVSETKITVFLRNISLKSAVETICRLNNLWYREGNNVITIMTENEYTKDLVSRKNERTRAFYIRYTNAADMAKVIEAAMGEQVVLAAVQNEKIYGYLDKDEPADVTGSELNRDITVASDSEKEPVAIAVSKTDPDSPGMVLNKNRQLAIMTVSKRNNCIIARSLDSDILTEIENIISALDTPTNQVLLEIKILQVTLGDKFESFFHMDYQGTGTMGSGGDFYNEAKIIPGTGLGATSIGYLFSNAKINARLELYQSQGVANIIASPFLMCANNSQVEFFVGEETPLRDDVKTKTITLGASENTVTTFEAKIKREEIGTDVKIATFINEDRTITLDVDIDISTANLNMTEISIINETTGDVIPFPLDGVNRDSMKSIICARSEQSIAIGGIIRETSTDQETKVPFLGDIPFLGYLFKEKHNEKKKTETVIILTPHIIVHPALAGKTSDAFLNRKSSHPTIIEKKDTLLDYKTRNHPGKIK